MSAGLGLVTFGGRVYTPTNHTEAFTGIFLGYSSLFCLYRKQQQKYKFIPEEIIVYFGRQVNCVM